ncbi:hypothetical protein AVEN_187903-1 [Araneus ventricosus]|uniref:Uncharacterized protein n=1 Tax=Araneus ventricosus TaxID=182803 RepID=A0A4Y2CTC3_ARAVE|nr:hypothetical protein AVEN_187903-1 [Araneus ventricosus]
MKFIQGSPRTLLDISLVKVTACVCSSFQGCSPNTEKDKFNCQWKLHSHWSFDRCKKCIDMINRNISLLKLPRELKKPVADLCRPIYKEIIAWNIGLKQLHSKIIPSSSAECSCLDEVSLCESFQWKSSGSINGKKTAQKLIHDNRLDVRFRFLLACHYCFEDDVISLSKKMPDVPTSDIGSFTYTFLPLCAYWADWLRGEEINVLNRYSYAIKHFFLDNSYFSFIVSNATALRHFSQKLSPISRSCFSTSVAMRLSQNPEVMRFCLSEADEEQQEHIFRINPRAVLLSFVDWPWQRHFLEVADRMWTFLKGRDFSFFIKKFCSKINAEWHDFDYTRLLTEYWDHSPIHLKEYVRNQHEDLMCDLINTIKMNDHVHSI